MRFILVCISLILSLFLSIAHAAPYNARSIPLPEVNFPDGWEMTQQVTCERSSDLRFVQTVYSQDQGENEEIVVAQVRKNGSMIIQTRVLKRNGANVGGEAHIRRGEVIEFFASSVTGDRERMLDAIHEALGLTESEFITCIMNTPGNSYQHE